MIRSLLIPLTVGSLLAGSAALASGGPLAKLAPAPLAQATGVHEDARYGFKLRPPKGWDTIPIQIHDDWQVAKWLSDKTYFYTDPDNGWTFEHRPTLKVVAFVTKLVKERARATKVKDEKSERIRILIDNPYKDYQDYLRRTYGQGGWYVHEESETEVHGLKVTRYHIKVEKLAYTGPKRIEAWIYHTPEVDFAVEFELPQDAWGKLDKTVTRTLKSFEEIARTEGGLPTASTGVAGTFLISEEAYQEDLTPKERAKRRKQLEASEHLRAIETLPDGWDHEQHGRILVLNHARDKLAKQRAAQVQAVFDWLDDTLPFVGPGEYVRAPILRICADREEENSYRRGGQGLSWGGMGTEITGHNDNSGQLGYETEWLNMRALDIWFQDRDRELYWALPEWLDYGLKAVVQNTTNKRGKLDFRMDDYERQSMRDLGREEQWTPPRELMLMGREAFVGGGDYRIVHESQSLVRFFLCGNARRSSATKEVLPEYLKNLRAVITEIAAEDDEKGSRTRSRPTTEEEEEAYFRAQRQGWKDRERRILDETFQRTFGEWDEKDWARFEKAYFKTVD